MASYRSRLKIVADVLSVVRGGAKKTQVMYQANLSYKLLTRYLRDVIKAGLVSKAGENHYKLTPKGFEFLRAFNDYYENRQKLRMQLTHINKEKEVLENSFLDNAKNARGKRTDME